MKDQICKLRGSVQHYAWGGYDFIPSLFGQVNRDKKPFAEYWLGAHPSGPSDVEVPGGTSIFLHDAIRQLPFKYIGEEVEKRFGCLPYLLKVLDVHEMLSIQVHPTKEEAIKGFEREEAAGIPINAPHRNYRDKNHKPEVMIALSDFWLLHGFKMHADLLETLNTIPAFNNFTKIFTDTGYYGLYKHVMEMPQQEADQLLKPLVEEAIQKKAAKNDPAYWVSKLYNTDVPSENLDKGIFSIYFFNLVHLSPGEAIFQGAGVPHAYLQGQNVELMANSDNVLRGGLTPKHVDVPELLKHIQFEGIVPKVLTGEKINKVEALLELPVEDFGISTLTMPRGSNYSASSYSAEIFLVMEGEVIVETKLFSKGEAFLILPGTTYTIIAKSKAVLYKSFVPKPAEN